MTDGWIGRVFGSGTTGGNHAAVITGPDMAPRQRATALGFRNVTFVGQRKDRLVHLRTFTPREELPLCVTAALATPVALGARPGESWRIEHRGGVLEVSVRGSAELPVCWTIMPSTSPPRPVTTLPSWLPANQGVWRLGQTRSRLYVHLDDPADLALFDPAALRRFCTDNDCRGLVMFTADGPIVRSREFSLVDDAELTATGGAASGIGLLLRLHGATADTEIVQGPPGSAAQGRLLLRFGADGPEVGGQVLPLVQGTLAGPAASSIDLNGVASDVR
ncbi:MAG TPA: PhzF family phenazine biosynthesis protein [Pseudonocardiaceae bacterium]|jgi:predicted PhzF superfamily epimerase YddE/YHI9|nr:PhzF family phenazine biosynthesis protein [Pseudonocardiaceae bacterium]